MRSPDTIFINARELSDEARAAYLAEACGKDASLRARVDAMLRSAEEAGEYFGDIEGSVVSQNARLAEGPGTIIGRYKLLQRIGEGGMGVVYLAEQREPVVRKVALKVIKLGMDTKAVVARFEAERQALALMDHPNIAKVLDAGETETARPYFVMDLVQGLPITQFCDNANLAVAERLDLFLGVCSAIEHAHQKGIIHRDIKPSNILVALHGGKPAPKVIDFGIAKATQQRLTEKTLFTQFQQLVGTPAYMSPEQASLSGLDIDTRTDIYSLGVLLYQLLSGRTPFEASELIGAGFDEMRRTIIAKEPKPPSTRLSTMARADLATTARQRQAEPLKLIRYIRGDLDWIVMKCLEKDRARRYETVGVLAADIQRHLSNQPILARPPSAIYQVRKAFQRNRLVFTAIGAVATALVLGIIGSSWQAIRAANAERKEGRLRQEAESARVQESHLRKRAEDEAKRAEEKELIARRYLYDSQIKLAHQAMLENRLGRALELLEAQRPAPDQQDLRGWEWRYLWRACQSDELRTLSRHSGLASAVAFSPDGQWIASGDESGILKIGKMIQPTEEREFSIGSVYDLAFSPDGKWLAAAAESGVNLRQFPDSESSWTLPQPRRVYSVAFSPDGLRLATVWGDQVSIWSVASRKEISRFAPLAPRFTQELAFSPDNETLAIGFGHGQICLWNLVSNAPSALLPGHRYIRGGSQVVTALAFSPDGALLASGGWDKAIKLWKLPEGNLIADIPAHGAWVSDITFSPDGKVVASVSADQTIKLWDTRTWRAAGALRGHGQPISSVAFAPDNRSLATCAEDGAVKIWRVDKSSLPPDSLPLAGNGAVSTLSEDGEWLFAEYFASSFLIVETATMKTNRYAIPLPNYFSGTVAPGGQMVALTSEEGEVLVCGLHSSSLEELARAKVHAGKINYLAFSRDATLLVTAGEDKFVRLWQARELIEVQHFSTADAGYGEARFSRDGRLLGIGYHSGLTRVWDWRQSRDFFTLRGNGRGVTGLAFSNAGDVLVTAGYDGSARFWNLSDRQPTNVLRGNFTGLSGIDLSPDGQRLAAGTFDGTIILWDLSTGQELLTFSGHREIVSQVRFTRDGNSLVAASLDSVSVWRADPLAHSDTPSRQAAPVGR